MDKAAVINFFDRFAKTWDDDMVRNDEIIGIILDNAGVGKGSRVLDVACGTGVLFPDYFARGAFVTGIDIAPGMADRAREKFPEAEVICADVLEYPFGRTFDIVVVYNAFPHFPDPEAVVERLASLTRPGGRMTVAHGMSREKLLQHHAGSAADVSIELLEAPRLAEVFSRRFDVDTVISDERMYQVAGTRR